MGSWKGGDGGGERLLASGGGTGSVEGRGRVVGGATVRFRRRCAAVGIVAARIGRLKEDEVESCGRDS